MGIAPPSSNSLNLANLDTEPPAAQGALYYKGPALWETLAPGASGQILKSNGAGANPGWLTPSGVGDMLAATYDPLGIASNAFNLANMVAASQVVGDLLAFSAGSWQVLHAGGAGKVLTSGGVLTLPSWQNPAGDMLAATYDPGAVALNVYNKANHGYAAENPGDLSRRGATAWERLGIGTAGYVLTSVAGYPVWAAPSGGLGRGWSIPGLDDLAVTEHQILSIFEARLSAVTVDAVPTSQNHVDSNHCLIAVEVTTQTSSGTLRLTGTSYDPTTGGTTPADTEDIVVSGTGWYESTKEWEGTVVLSSVGGLDVILDSYAYIPEYNLQGATFEEAHFTWEVSGGTNSMRMLIRTWDATAGFATVVDDTISNITVATISHHMRTALATAVAADGTLLISVYSQRVINARIEMVFS